MPFGVVRAVKCIGLAPACCELGDRSAGARIRYAWRMVVLIWREATRTYTRMPSFRCPG